MTRDEAKKIVMVIMSSYPNWHPADLSFTVDTWAAMLGGYSYSEIAMALKAFITTDASGFAPSIGQIIQKLQDITCKSELNEMEAWSMVSKALRNGYYGAEEEFERFPEVVKKAVGSPSQLRNWSQTSSDSVENVIQSNFMRTYRAELSRAKEYQKMPQEIKRLVNEATSSLTCLPENGRGNT